MDFTTSHEPPQRGLGGSPSVPSAPPARPPTCPRCGSTRLHPVKSEGPHFGNRVDCLDCGLPGAVKASWTIERARAFTMPYGKHKGRTVAELAETGPGRSYLRWVAENVDGNAGMAAAIVLKGVAPNEH